MKCDARRPILRLHEIFLLLLLLLVSGCSDDNRVVSPGDTIPPRPVNDLSVVEVDSLSVLVTWTATGDDDTVGVADRYDLRHSTFTYALWEEMTVVSGLPRPGPNGTRETQRVTGLRAETRYWFRIAVGDKASNWSIPSPPLEVLTTGTERIPPARVTDLTSIATTQTSVTLTWTATGDDGHEGRASRYDLRYSLRGISEATWASATPVGGLPAPSLPGTLEQHRVTALLPLTVHYFALKVADDRDNWSPLSNVVVATTVDE